jgi:hypothetical protein
MVKTRRVKLKRELRNLMSHHGANMARYEGGKRSFSRLVRCRK